MEGVKGEVWDLMLYPSTFEFPTLFLSNVIGINLQLESRIAIETYQIVVKSFSKTVLLPQRTSNWENELMDSVCRGTQRNCLKQSKFRKTNSPKYYLIFTEKFISNDSKRSHSVVTFLYWKKNPVIIIYVATELKCFKKNAMQGARFMSHSINRIMRY